MTFNLPILLLAAIIPLILGFIWYHPKVFGTVWMNASGLNAESMKGVNMVKIFSLTFIFSFIAALAMQFVVIHQFHMYSILANEVGIKDPTSEIGMYLKNFMDKYGNNFRTFKHGALHGTITGIFLIFPIIGINGLFERKSFKYILINAGFWTVSLALMGGIICGYDK